MNRSALDEAYIHLPADAAALYRKLGVCPLEWIDRLALAALLNQPAPAAEPLAATLAGLGLVESTERGYALTYAQRLHARSRADESAFGQPDLAEPVADEGLGRVFNYFLGAAAAAERLITPWHVELWPYRQEWVEQPAPFDLSECSALNWLTAQLPNYMAIIRHASLDGRHALVCELAHRLWPLWWRRNNQQERYEAQVLGLASATALHDDDAYGQMLTSLAGTVRAARPQEAHDYNLRAVAHYRETGDSLGLAQALNAVAKDLLAAGDLDRAEAEFRQAQQLRTTIGYERGAALSQQGLGLVALARGAASTAAVHLVAAYQTLLATGDTYDAAVTQAHHARAIAAGGAIDQALVELGEAHAALKAATSESGAAMVLGIRGDVLFDAGRVNEALDVYAEARRVYDRLDPSAAERLQARVSQRLLTAQPTDTAAGPRAVED